MDVFIFSLKKLYASDVVLQITTNIIRPLSPSLNIYFDPDEDEPSMEPAWPHLSVGGITYCMIQCGQMLIINF